ncbi:MAG: hypothetical protein ACK5M7_13780 [Draconibacterium sp.]
MDDQHCSGPGSWKVCCFLTTATLSGMFFSPIIIQPIQNIVGLNTCFLVLGIALAVLSVVYDIVRRTLKMA